MAMAGRIFKADVAPVASAWMWGSRPVRQNARRACSAKIASRLNPLLEEDRSECYTREVRSCTGCWWAWVIILFNPYFHRCLETGRHAAQRADQTGVAQHRADRMYDGRHTFREDRVIY
jgi:hypothetical protein